MQTLIAILRLKIPLEGANAISLCLIIGQQPRYSQIMQSERHVRLFRNGRNQALRIPRELELDADEAIIRRDGTRLIIEPVQRRQDLATLLAGWQPLDETLPDIDDGLLSLDDVQL